MAVRVYVLLVGGKLGASDHLTATRTFRGTVSVNRSPGCTLDDTAVIPARADAISKPRSHRVNCVAAVTCGSSLGTRHRRDHSWSLA